MFDDWTTGAATTASSGLYGWTGSGTPTAGQISRANSEANAPGIIKRTTAATINSLVTLQLGSQSQILRSTELFDIKGRVRFPSFDAATMAFRFGVMDDPTAPANGMWVQQVAGSADVFGQTKGSVSPFTLTTGMALGTVLNNTWHTYRVRRIDSTTIGFTFDGGTELTLASTPVFNWSYNVSFNLQTTVAVAKVMDIDYFGMSLAPTRT